MTYLVIRVAVPEDAEPLKGRLRLPQGLLDASSRRNKGVSVFSIRGLYKLDLPHDATPKTDNSLGERGIVLADQGGGCFWRSCLMGE